MEQIAENPYLQYFIGLHGFREEATFDTSTLVHFSKRISAEMLMEVNKGSLTLDATCAPANIRYPQDIPLLYEAREKLENMI